MITGNTLIEWGFTPGAWFKNAIEVANRELAVGVPLAAIEEKVRSLSPAPPIVLRTNSIPFAIYAGAEGEDARENLNAVIRHMDNLMRVPTIKHGAVMPDACPTGGAEGTIPVGGIVACENAIHPSFHSADICCSVAISVFGRNVDPKKVLDIAEHVTHFGPGGRLDNGALTHKPLTRLVSEFEGNSFLKGLEERALRHFMTQGDGNHFFFVGDFEGHTAVVTHHGSRGLGADLYKRGKACAERMTAKIANVPAHQSWIQADSDEGREYWNALQVVRDWTKLNHFEIHDAVARRLGVKVVERFWNEHNFVFQKSDGLFYHAKGATPSYAGFSSDDQDMTLIPLNMKAGVLIGDHSMPDALSARLGRPSDALGFCPHGAGRNMSRSAHMRFLRGVYGDARGLSDHSLQHILKVETEGIDARFWNGVADLSELPSAYKNAEQIEEEIRAHKLVKIASRVVPHGCIMAGNGTNDWKKFKADKKAESDK